MINTLFSISKIVARGNYCSYEIGPLEDFLALSIANSLRRVLLASLPGAAITSVRINGVQHEFQDVEYVREDVAEIVQHLKGVRFRSYSDRPVTILLDVTGEQVVTAGDIKVPSTIEVVNPEAHIATLDNEQASLSMEMIVTTGRGFVPFDAQSGQESLPMGVISIDAIYSPVVHVSYVIKDSIGGQQEITLEITTDGAILPDEALRQAAEILLQQFSVFTGEFERDESFAPPFASDTVIPQHIYNMPFVELGLNARIYNSLKRSGISVVGQLLEMDDEAMLSLRNFGERSLLELAETLKRLKLLPSF